MLRAVQRSCSFATVALVAACTSPPSSGGLEAAVARSPGEDAPAWHFLRTRYDSDHDGRIQRAEYRRSAEAFHRLDADGDGVVSAPDFDPRWDGVPRIEATHDEKARGRWIGMRDFVHGEGGPEVGDAAPLFRLTTTSGEEVDLSSFRGKKPVALVFGSYT